MSRVSFVVIITWFVFHPIVAQTEYIPFVSISPDSIKKHLFVLGNDSLQGRGTGYAGCEKTALYICNVLRGYGIRPFSPSTGFMQTFPLHGSKPMEETRFTLYAPKDSYALRLKDDYVLYSAGAQTFTPAPIPVVFVGYGIVAPEYDYNDYRNIDVKNCIVVFLSGEPNSGDDIYFDGEKPTIHASLNLKQKIALAHGAKGSILLPNPNDRSMDDWFEQQRQFLFEDVHLLVAPSENLNVMINPKLGPFVFSDAEYSFDEIAEFDRKGTMKSFRLPFMASFQGQFQERDFLSSNIIGIIEGTDPQLQDSYLLLSAHYDHLGIGTPIDGDSIYNGVIDNASGVVALLELTRIFSRSEFRPRRSILVVFLTGEERGFLGSQYYCLHPVVPLYKTAANVNIDGLSLFDRMHSVVGVGAELSTLGRSLDDAVHSMGLEIDSLFSNLSQHNQFRNSDQFMFAQAGIPSILVAEGLRYESTSFEEGIKRYVAWSEERYHSPFDDLHQPINFAAAVQHVEILFRFSAAIANDPHDPQWNLRSPFINARLISKAEKK